jgi:DNA repair protein RadC
MRIYEASIAYNLVQLGDVQALTTPDKIVEYLRDGYAKNPCQESLWVICLNRKNKPISRTMVTLGTLTSALAHPREVFKIAILASAAAIVVSHNHPSGDPAPSSADIQLTRQLREAAKIIGIDLIDHVIVGTAEDDPLHVGYYSFRAVGQV